MRIAAALGRSAALLCLAAGIAAPAAAARWVDKYGRVTTLLAPGLVEATLHPNTQRAAEAAARFKALCLDTGLERAAAGRAAEAAGFRYVAATMPFKTPVDVGSWVSNDAELAVARDMFFAKEPQCTLVVALAGADMVGVTVSVSALIGEPVNATKALRKDGTPDRRWQPEWLVPGSTTGLERRVFLHDLNRQTTGQFLLAVIERKGAK